MKYVKPINEGHAPEKRDRVRIFVDPFTQQNQEGVAIVLKIWRNEVVDKHTRCAHINCRFEHPENPGKPNPEEPIVERMYVWAE